MSSPAGRIVCEECGKSYPWRPEYAGKKVKCACGHAMLAPSEAPPAPTPEPDLYDLAEEPAPPKPVKIPKTAPTPANDPPAATTAAPKAKAAPQSAMLAYAQAQKAPASSKEDFANEISGSPTREIYVPSILLVIGLIANVILYMREDGNWVSFTSVAPAIGVSLLFNLVLSFIGLLLVSKWFEISFGHPGTAVLKMSACILLPTALANILGGWIGSDSDFVAMMASATLMFPLTFVAIWYLFQLAADEAFWCVAVIYIVTDWATKFLLAIVLSAASDDGSSLTAPAGPGGNNAAIISDDDE